MALYENIAVTRSGEKSKSTLPIMPISLPRNAGIQMILPILNVAASGDKMYGKPLIPLIQGQEELLQTDTLLNDLMGRWAYTPLQKTVVYNKDLTTYGITLVDMKLVVFDMAQYGINDTLPIPADFQQQILDELYVQFGGVQPETAAVNNFTTLGQNAPTNVKQ